MADRTPHPKATEEQIEDLKAKHGAIFALESQGYQVIVRHANRREWQRFRESSIDDRKRASAVERLFLDATVYPGDAEIKAMLEHLPGLAETFGAEVAELAGAVKGGAEKKDL